MIKSKVPDTRIKTVTTGKMPANRVQANGEYVLYWMIANRRTRDNFSLQRAVDWAVELGKPLLVFEALRAGYRWNCDRFHAFVIQGMLDNAAALTNKPVTYFPYLEPKHGDGRGLLKKLASKACVVISDDFPCFFLPRMTKAAADQIPCLFELVDSNGLLPMRITDRVFSRAFDFRRHMQKNILEHLPAQPKSNPFSRIQLPVLEKLPESITKKWKPLDAARGTDIQNLVTQFPIDHSVPISAITGGSAAAHQALKHFLQTNLEKYNEARNQPEQQVTSGLSPYLHFGHISAHRVFNEVVKRESWSPEHVSEKVTASSTGWWNMSPPAESFVDELITWREVGYNFTALRDDYAQYESLPHWAQDTLEEHRGDEREHIYSLEQFETSQTHDDLWNAAQRQLVVEGRIHNYLRMLWGKKILHWTRSPRTALDIMIELNNKYALDGRDPNSYSGIFWVLGRYDRAWGPERPIFGKIRYMTSDSTRRKFKVNNYIEKYLGDGALEGSLF